MRVTVVLKQRAYVRIFAGTLRELASRGHHVRVLWQEPDTDVPPDLQGSDNIVVGPAPPRRRDAWRDHASLLRRASDYLRYLDGPYRGATKLRARAFEKMLRSLGPAIVAQPEWSDGPLGLGIRERERLQGLLQALERSVPSDPDIEALITEDRPDVLLVSPLVDLGSSQADFVKSARVLGVPVGVLVFSWDDLSTKGTLHGRPDRLFAWNERQRREAVELHGFPSEHVVVTGAPRFDVFFAQRPTLTRDEFCAPLEFDPAQPILMYVCSSKFVAAREKPFVERWIAAIRASTAERLRDCNILVRPHPDDTLSDAEGPSVTFRWPRIRLKGWLTRPFIDARTAVVRTSYSSPQAFFECLHHSAAVVGLNTSAEIEAGIAGRPVFTVRADEDLADGQHGTLHFHYLLEENGGFVRCAPSLDTHVTDLERALTDGVDGSRIYKFITNFVRPAGRDRDVSSVLADAIEECATHHQPKPVLPEPSDQIVRLDYKVADIRLHITSGMEHRHRARSCAKEPWTVQWLEERLKPGDVLYDIGTNVGAFTLIAAKHLGASVVAFEPGYANYARLCENLVLNLCHGSVIPLPIALADKTGLLGFNYRTLEPGQSRHALQTAPWHWQSEVTAEKYVQPVCTMRLDDVVSQFDLPLPTHMKIDVDGGELRVLCGAEDVLRRAPLRSIMAEVEHALLDAATALLQRAGFVLEARFGREARSATCALFVR